MGKSDLVTSDDVGSYFQDSDGVVWKLIAYTDQPQATFETENREIYAKQFDKQVRHTVGSRNYHGMGIKKLIIRPDK